MTRVPVLWLALVVLFVCAAPAESQSRLNFPKVLSVDELRTSGFALVNTSSSPAAANFSLYGADGRLLASSTVNVPVGGQVARLGSEIFTSAGGSGWVQVTSSNSELQGFELLGDFATVTDGAGPAPEAAQLVALSFSREDVVHIVNPSSRSGTVQITLYDATGRTLNTRSVPLAAFQPASLRLTDAGGDDNVDMVTLRADMPISASVITKLAGGLDIAVTNAVAAAGAPSDLLFPFVPNGSQGGSNWRTLIGVGNLAATSQPVSLTFTPDGGAPLTIQRTLAPSGSLGDSIDRLFPIAADSFTAGWIRVTGSGPLVGVVAYQDSAAGSLATVPSQSAGASRFFFGHIASLAPWYTGVALLNTNPVAANVEVFALDSSGQLVGAPASFSLAGGTRRTALLSELIPQLPQRTGDGGFVFVRTTNGMSLVGFELFGHGVFPILANVQGFALPSTSTFTPPGGTTPGAITVDRITFTDGTNAKSQFQPRDAIAYVPTVTNSSGTSVPAQLTYGVKDPRGEGMFNISIPLTLDVGSVDLPFRSFIPSNALNGQYTFTVTLTYQKQTITKSAVFTVTGGATTPSLTQESPIPTSTLDALRFAFRPGEVARFAITTSNFLGPVANAGLNYQLMGPGSFIAGIGSLTYTVPPGVSFRMLDIAIPASAPLGIYAFSATLMGGGNTSTKDATITIAPPSSAERADIDTVFVTDSDGIPRAGFTPGSNIRLFTSRLSFFAISIPATVRYMVTGPNSSTVANQSLGVNLTNGRSLGSLPLTLSSSAPPGTYTFQATLTYTDNANATITSTANMEFTVAANPPTLKSTITVRRPHVEDFNLVARPMFSPGEPIVLVRTVYSTFSASVAGTVRYQVMFGQNLAYDQTFNVTFLPGMNTSFLTLSTGATLPVGTYTLNVTATAQGEQSTSSTTFLFSGPRAPVLNFDRISRDEAQSEGPQEHRR